MEGSVERKRLGVRLAASPLLINKRSTYLPSTYRYDPTLGLHSLQHYCTPGRKHIKLMPGTHG